VDTAMPNNALAPDDVAAIKGLIELWYETVQRGDWDTALGMCTDDFVFMPPEGLPVQGEAVRPWVEAFPTIKSVWWNIEDLHGHGDLGCIRGFAKDTLDVDGVEVLTDLKYCDVVRKGDDGKWRFAIIIWNSNVPAAAQ
jgi:ketosteroid isomerase-like protein